MAIKASIIVPDQQVDQDNSCTLKGVLTGPDHTEAVPQYIPGTSVTVATLDLYDAQGNAIGTQRIVTTDFDANGNFRYVLTATDNAIVGSAVDGYEDHIAVLAATFDAGGGETHSIKKNIRIRVKELTRT